MIPSPLSFTDKQILGFCLFMVPGTCLLVVAYPKFRLRSSKICFATKIALRTRGKPV